MRLGRDSGSPNDENQYDSLHHHSTEVDATPIRNPLFQRYLKISGSC